MEKCFFCTYFDNHYLTKGLALYNSLNRHCKPFHLWILCLDNITHEILTKMRLPHVSLISLSEFENGDFQLLEAKQNRSLIEYYFTCTPSLPIYILNLSPEVNLITYLDADLFFFSPIRPVFHELGHKSILIIEHRFASCIKNSPSGIYNVGLLSFRRDAHGMACLRWWRDRCLEWCYDRVEDGKYADQKYLDDWPDRFSEVVVLQHKGVGLAPWNYGNYRYSYEKGKLLVDEQEVIMCHIEGFKCINHFVYDSNIRSLSIWLPFPRKVKKYIYHPYAQELFTNNKLLKNYGYSKYKSGGIRLNINKSSPKKHFNYKESIRNLLYTLFKKYKQINEIIVIIPK